MAKQNAPWFAFNVHDWLTSIDIQRMTLAEVGAYINLLARAWDSDPIATLPNDPSKLWKLAGARSLAEFEAVAPVVLAMFEDQDGRLVNRRLLEETARLNVAEASRIDKARNAAKIRWANSDAQACSSNACDARDAKQTTETDSAIKPTTESVVTESVESARSLSIGSQSQSIQKNPTESATPPQSTPEERWAALVASFEKDFGPAGPEPDFRWAKRMAEQWIELRKSVNYRSNDPDPVDPEDFKKLVSPHWQQKAGFSKPIPRGEIEACMRWAVTVSRTTSAKAKTKGHWGNPNVLKGTAGFVNAFGTIKAQCFNYYAAIKSHNKEIDERTTYNFERMRSESAPFDDGTTVRDLERSKSTPVRLPEPIPTPAPEKPRDKVWDGAMQELQDRIDEGNVDAKRRQWFLDRGLSKEQADREVKSGRALSVTEIAQMVAANRVEDTAMSDVSDL